MLLRLRTRRWKLWFESSYLIQNSKFQIDKPTDVLYIHDLHVNQLFLYLINVSCVVYKTSIITWQVLKKDQDKERSTIVETIEVKKKSLEIPGRKCRKRSLEFAGGICRIWLSLEIVLTTTMKTANEYFFRDLDLAFRGAFCHGGLRSPCHCFL